jgi:hypothetical protein
VVVTGDTGFAEWSFTETTPDGGRRLIRGCDRFQFRDGQISKKDAYRKVLGTVPGTTGHNKRDEVTAMSSATSGSPVTAVAAAPAEESRHHFEQRLAHETDPADVWKAIETGRVDFVLVDCRPGPATTRHTCLARSACWCVRWTRFGWRHCRRGW